MQVNLQKWGNSAAMRLPAPLLAQMGLHVGDALDIEVSGDHLTIRKARPKYRLADLLAEMPGEFPRVAGWDEQPDTGLEVC